MLNTLETKSEMYYLKFSITRQGVELLKFETTVL